MIFFNSYKCCFDYIYDHIKKKSNLIISGGATINSLLNNCNKNKSFYDNKILLSDERLIVKKSIERNDFFFKNLIKRKLIKKENFINYKKKYLCEKSLNAINKTTRQFNSKIAILGLGINNHIASIFENTDEISNDKYYYYINNSPKKPKERVTISIKKLKQVNKIFLIVNKKKRKNDLKKIKSSKIFYLLKKNLNVLIIK